MSSLNFPSGSARLIDANFASALQIILENAPSAFAVTEGPAHTLVYANDAFRRVFGAPEANVAAAITDVLLPEAITRMQSLLDRALTSQAVLHERFLGLLARGKDYRYCTIWPL